MAIEYPVRDGKTIPLLLVDPGSTGGAIRLASGAERKPGEAALGDDDASVVSIDERTLLLTWVGTICETGYTLALSSGLGRVVIAGDARKGCDTGRVVYALALTLPAAVDPDAFVIDLRPPILLDS
jgi:hypothetical protein